MVPFMKKTNKKKLLIEVDNSIKKSNELSVASLSAGLTLNQAQLLAFAIFNTQLKEATSFNKASFESKFNRRYNTEDAVIDSWVLLNLKFGLLNLEKNKFHFYNVFQDIGYDQGDFQFQWSEKILPHILELKENGRYVLTDLTISAQFKSAYSWILYDYLRGHYGYFHLTLTKEKALTLFNVSKTKSYVKNTSIFKRKVLDVAIAELNDYTELNVSYKELKKGKSIIGFDIHWSSGKLIYSATEKQVIHLKNLVNTVKEDAVMYVNLSDDGLRSQAIGLLKKVEGFETFTQTPSPLTAEAMSEKIQEVNGHIRKLNLLVEDDNLTGMQVPLFNWLDGE